LRRWERETKRQKSEKISTLPWQYKAKEKQIKIRRDPGFAFCFIFYLKEIFYCIPEFDNF
jgi:hypothetical protein